ncbi:MAG: head GIN domain-containing protein [Chitinophagaceae bacterium]
MKKQCQYLFFLSIPVLLITGCIIGGQTVTGNGQVTSINRQTGDYNGIVVAGSMHVFVKQGPAQDIRIEAESNLIPYIETHLKDNQIEIRFKRNVHVTTHEPVNIYLTTPEISNLSLLGSGNIQVQDSLANSDKIKLNVAGSGDIELQMNAPELDANIAGSGNILISGETKNIILNILGSGDFKGSNLKSEQATVKIAGSGNAHVFSSIKLTTKILGSGNVYYEGSPSIETTSAGSGKVTKEN